jgi:hypothetical protein
MMAFRSLKNPRTRPVDNAGPVVTDRRSGRNDRGEGRDADRRLHAVKIFRFVQRLSYSRIVEALATLDPPIASNKPQISRDVQKIRKYWANELAPENFDARAAVGELIERYRHIWTEAITRLSNDDRPLRGAELAGVLRVALSAAEREQTLLQDAGLIDHKLGELTIDPTKAAKERIPSAPEIAALVAQANREIESADFMSEGEKEQRYGPSKGRVS